MSTPSERAEARRQTWTGGVASSFAEMDQRDLEFWLAMTPAERVGAMWSLVEET